MGNPSWPTHLSTYRLIRTLESMIVDLAQSSLRKRRGTHALNEYLLDQGRDPRSGVFRQSARLLSHWCYPKRRGCPLRFCTFAHCMGGNVRRAEAMRERVNARHEQSHSRSGVADGELLDDTTLLPVRGRTSHEMCKIFPMKRVWHRFGDSNSSAGCFGNLPLLERRFPETVS